MIASELMFKTWKGVANEYFTHMDMNRVEYNANIIASDLGVENVEFSEVTRDSQFDFSEALKLERLIRDCADASGISEPVRLDWSTMGSVSYVDFERWESSLYEIYQSRGGLGERISAGSVLSTYSFALFPSSWKDARTYAYIDLDAPAIHDDTEAVMYVPHTATAVQRAAEYAAVLKSEYLSDRRIRIVAVGLKPTVQIPMRLTLGGFTMYEIVKLSASSWSGSGPYTQTATLSNSYTNAVVGPQSGMSDSEVEAMAEGIISVSAINGKSVTFRAVGTKPAVDVNVGVMGA